MKHRFWLPVVGLLCLAIPAGAVAQSGTEGQITELLDVAERLLGDEGYRRVENRAEARLAARAAGTHRVAMRAGVPYAIFGVCDTGCSDLDLGLSDSAGKMLAEDVADDDAPIVLFTPTTTGFFTVTASMIRCSAPTCSYGFVIMEQTRAPKAT